MRSQELETVPKLAPWPLLASPHGAGERIGPFALVSLLGRGGMGEVWLARQADGRVERDVALKLAALHQPATIVVLVLGQKRIFMRAVDHALPERADQVQEARGLDDFPAVGFELVRGLGCHVVRSVFLGCHAVRIVSSDAPML